MKKVAWLVSALLLAGCGGGGGGGESGSVLPVYTGISTAAPLDNTLAAGQFAYAILVPAEAGQIGTLPLSPGEAPGVAVLPSAREAVLRALRLATPPAGTAGPVKPRAVYTETFPGAEGGAMVMTITTGIWTNTGTEYVTRADISFQNFDDIVDGISNPMNGTMSIVPDTWTADGLPVYYVASFDLHVSLDPVSGGRITGSLDYHQVSTTDMRPIYTWNNTLITDDQTKIQVWWNPLVEIDEDIFTDRELLTVTGKVYISYLGYVTVSTSLPFDFPTSADLDPISGKMLLTGEQDKATVTVQGTVPEVFVELDSGGNGTIDSTNSYAWQDLAF